jgi:hypothetical protein
MKSSGFTNKQVMTSGGQAGCQVWGFICLDGIAITETVRWGAEGVSFGRK